MMDIQTFNLYEFNYTMDTYKKALLEFMDESGKVWESESKCEIIKKWFKFKTTDEWYQLFLIYWKKKFDLWIKTELDVTDCDNAFAYTRILCRNLLNKL